MNVYTFAQLNKLSRKANSSTVSELKMLCKEFGIPRYSKLRKDELIKLIVRI